jgi:hypothetical protein
MSTGTTETRSGGMSFREVNARYLEPGSQWVMVLGIVLLCQPWNMELHSYGVTIILAGLIGFNVFAKIRRPGRDN